MQWKNPSIGDLEALDSILDTLVVADPKMREALLRGPLISFETVVPEPVGRTRMPLDDGRDNTFMTAVQGLDGTEGQLGGLADLCQNFRFSALHV